MGDDKAKNHAYYLAHKAEFAARKKAWHKTPKGIVALKKEKKAFYERHKARILAGQRVYAKENLHKRRANRAAKREKINAQKRAWHWKNLDKVKAQAAASHLRHKAERNAKSKRYYEEHKERMLALANEWKENNRQKRRAICAAWKKRNPVKDLATVNRRRARIASVTFDESANTFYMLVKSSTSVQCAYCGLEMDGKDCHVDHVIPISKGGAHTASNLCVSCPACNHKKSDKLPHEFQATKNVCSDNR